MNNFLMIILAFGMLILFIGIIKVRKGIILTGILFLVSGYIIDDVYINQMQENNKKEEILINAFNSGKEIRCERRVDSLKSSKDIDIVNNKEYRLDTKNKDIEYARFVEINNIKTFRTIPDNCEIIENQ